MPAKAVMNIVPPYRLLNPFKALVSSRGNSRETMSLARVSSSLGGEDRRALQADGN